MTDYANRSARGRAPDDDEATLRARLEADLERDRRRAALGLIDLADDGGLTPATIGGLVELVLADDSPDVRQFAVEALGLAADADGGDAAGDAIRAALNDDHEWVRAEAVVAQSRAEPGNETPLRDALEDDSGWVRRNAVIALSKTGAASQELLIEQLKTDPHSGVREYAADYLREYADDVGETVRILAAVLARDPEAFVRAKAATSLGDLGTDRAEEVLERHGLNDRSDDVRRSAKRALATARGVDPEQIDAGLDDDAAPGGGPGSRREQERQGPGPGQGPAGSIDGLTQGQRDRR
ncbi:HEAT repeat domain-containing protein [Natrinema salsiterrestre]|uniref:HEAT repeat domain-containing protein n=1 Tax=Natrinema salsiterrestre TaxID=2950540 RepID=A0A9Q4Q2I8_9EURY|nr:HEAT repeat domain-containing protein [Natrinema salsiterrestre]MDF9746566.1 HEAT repeat domain-containing protein [Natrinema salsiterrestre]